MKRSPARILAVTAGLVAGGALFGSLSAAVAITLLMALLRGGVWTPFLLAAVRIGAQLGAVLLPIAGWTLLRRVPLWRTLTGTIVGTVTGSIVGTVVVGMPLYPFGLTIGPVFGAIAGFLWAAIRLRRRFPAVAVAERIRVPHGG